MSLAEQVSKPFPVLTRLLAVLRDMAAVRFVVAWVTALLRGHALGDHLPVGGFLDPTPGAAHNTLDRPAAASPVSHNFVVAKPEPDDRFSEREQLIRRRWSETGVKMWNPGFHGAGRAALNIQGRVGVLPVSPGERLPAYDKLEFRLIGLLIVCEGVVVDPPACRK